MNILSFIMSMERLWRLFMSGICFWTSCKTFVILETGVPFTFFSKYLKNSTMKSMRKATDRTIAHSRGSSGMTSSTLFKPGRYKPITTCERPKTTDQKSHLFDQIFPDLYIGVVRL